MRLFYLTTLTMIAFAANSVLNRMALVDSDMDAVLFAALRLLAGAVMLATLALVLRGRLTLGGAGRATGVVSLLVYVFGFSAAYRVLDTGLGALILFGTVQMTMFAGAAVLRERISLHRAIGAAVAFCGLAWLLWPSGGVVVSQLHGALMVAAGVGWGIYSLVGKTADDPLTATAANFVLATPVGLALLLMTQKGSLDMVADMHGAALAVVSGAITSGLGYFLWYSILPSLQSSVAAVAQLTVPVIAVLGGLLFLDEIPSFDFVLAAAVVLGGVAWSVAPFRKP